MIPILLIILKGGLNPYRFNAFYFIIIYSIIFSLPVIVIFILNIKINCCLNINFKNLFTSKVSAFFIIAIFFVKSPIYFLHFWLPKAHVEASTLGSIILASFMLKIGGVGIIKFTLWLNCKTSSNFTYLIVSLVALRFTCVLQSDFKKLVALTSVIHIIMSLVLLLRSVGANFKIFLTINLCHSLTRRLIFYFSGLIFKISFSRIIYLQRYLKYNTVFILINLVVLLNLGVPPFYTFLGEIIFFRSILLKNFYFLVISIIVVLLITLYRLLLMNNIKIFSSAKISMSSTFLFLVNLLLLLVF